MLFLYFTKYTLTILGAFPTTYGHPYLPATSSLHHSVEYTERGDFRIDRRVTVEVGGANKSHQQIAGIEEAYVAADDIEIGYGQKVPLWMFGLLY